MHWKTNKTKPIIQKNMDRIIIMDGGGYPYYNIKLEGKHNNPKIGGKNWEDIRNYVVLWQYMEIFESDYREKLSLPQPNINNKNNLSIKDEEFCILDEKNKE